MSCIEVVNFHHERKKKCPSCDRNQIVGAKVMLIKEEELVGDLELCQICCQVLLEVISKKTEKLVASWDFKPGEGGGEGGGDVDSNS